MDRMSKSFEPIEDERVTRMFQRTLALWAGDLLRHSAQIQWPAAQPVVDLQDRNWQSLYQGDVVEFGLGVQAVGRSSVTVTCVVRNKQTKQNICVADDIVFVHIDPETRKPLPHGKTKQQLDMLKVEAPA